MTTKQEIDILTLFQFSISKLLLTVQKLDTHKSNEMLIVNLGNLLSSLVFVIRDIDAAKESSVPILQNSIRETSSEVEFFNLWPVQTAENSAEYCTKIFECLHLFIAKLGQSKIWSWFQRYHSDNDLLHQALEQIAQSFFKKVLHYCDNTLDLLPPQDQVETYFSLKHFDLAKEVFDHTEDLDFELPESEVDRVINAVILRICDCYLTAEEGLSALNPQTINDVEAKILMYDAEILKQGLPPYFTNYYTLLNERMNEIKAQFLFAQIENRFPRAKSIDGSIRSVTNLLSHLYKIRNFNLSYDKDDNSGEKLTVKYVPKLWEDFISDYKVRKILSEKVLKKINATLRLPIGLDSTEYSLTGSDLQHLASFKANFQQACGYSIDRFTDEVKLNTSMQF